VPAPRLCRQVCPLPLLRRRRRRRGDGEGDITLVHTILAATAAANCRDWRDNPTFAYAAQRSASGFLSPPRRSGHTFYRTRGGFTLSARALRQIECAGAKAWFCLRESLFYVHTFLGELTKTPSAVTLSGAASGKASRAAER